MPALQEVGGASITEIDCVHPVVYFGDGMTENLSDKLHVMEVEDSVGITPSRATIRGIAGADVSSPQTLNAIEWPLNFGTRIRVALGGETIFLGNVMIRNDAGGADSVLWTALDDRIFLDNIPVRGCLVFDPTRKEMQEATQFSTRFLTHVNPNGLWNCTFANVNNVLCPVFSDCAAHGKSYEAPDEVFPAETEEAGKLTAWTPRRFLHYLCVLATLTPTSIYGTANWRSLTPENINYQRLKWNLNSVTSLAGADVAQGEIDPLDRKMPDMNFQGMTILGAIQKTLDVFGTHGLRLTYDGNSSRIAFFPRGYTAVVGANAKEIPLQRSGSVDDINTAYDFQLEENATRVAEAVLVEGDVVRVEAGLDLAGESRYFEGDPDAREDSETDTLEPAWTVAEENAFLYCIGNGLTDTDYYARVPAYQGQVDNFSSWSNADGNSGRPFAWKFTTEAAQIARDYFPTVYRAFRVKAANLDTILSGSGSKFNNLSKYPRLKIQRPILPEQLQFYLRDLTAGDTSVANRLLAHYPIRLRVCQRTEPAEWYEAPTPTIRVTGDGLLWIEGCAETVDSQQWCLYEMSLFNYAMIDDVKLKKIKLNVAMPMDHRVTGYSALSASPNETHVFKDGFLNSGSGLPMKYIDSPGAYRESHQVTSEPIPMAQFSNNSGYISSPVSRILPPGSEETHAKYAADRKLASAKHVTKKSRWSLIGLRPEYRAGDWIGKIRIRGSASDIDRDYDIQSPVETVLYRLEGKQETVLGGMIGEWS